MMKLAPGHAPVPDSDETDIDWAPKAEILKFFKGAIATAAGEPQPIPPETYDHIVARPDGGNDFVTSDQCMICHSGNAWMGSKFVMIVEPKSSSPVNVSPYGEWRWSPMGLAGRDPIFYAQLESELAYLKDRPADSQTVDQHLLPVSRRDGEAAAGHRQRLRSRQSEAGQQ